MVPQPDRQRDEEGRTSAEPEANGSEYRLAGLAIHAAIGKPNSAEMNPALADATQQQLPQLVAAMAHLGTVQSQSARRRGRAADVQRLVPALSNKSTYAPSMSCDGSTKSCAMSW